MRSRSGSEGPGPGAGPEEVPPSLRRSLSIVVLGALLGYSFALFLLPPGVHWDGVAMLFVFGGALSTTTVGIATRDTSSWLRRIPLAYLALALPWAILLPVVVFGSGMLPIIAEHRAWVSSALFIALALVGVGYYWSAQLREAGNEPMTRLRLDEEARTPFRWIWLSLGIAMLLGVGWLSYHQPGAVSLHFLYLVPTSVVAWATGRWGGMAMAIIAMHTHTFTQAVRFPEPAMSDPWLLVDTLILGIGLCIGANVVATLRGHLRAEEAAARADSLTGLLNRRAFLEQAERELARSVRYGRPVALSFIDLDGFKEVNDELGHAAGDRVLRVVGRVLKERTRATNVVARIGGDEFAILLTETDAWGASVALNNLRDALKARMDREGFPVTFSIGAVAGIATGETPESLMKAADRLMYRVKRSGKDRVAVEDRARSRAVG